jgi:group I intron endonuclease
VTISENFDIILRKEVDTMFIYSIINTYTNKIYIGKSTIENKTVRFREHKKKLKANEHCNLHLQNSYNKYGLNCFSYNIIHDNVLNNEELSMLERYYIDLFDSFNNGYNLTNGGEGTVGYNHTKESKELMSKLKKGKKIGKENSFFGKTHSEETKEKWKGRTNGKERKIINLNTGEIFNKITEAEKYYGLGRNRVSAVLLGQRKTVHGYRFAYLDAHDNTVPSLSYDKKV